MEEMNVKLNILDNGEIEVKEFSQEEFSQQEKGSIRELGEFQGFKFLDCLNEKEKLRNYYVMYQTPRGTSYYQINLIAFYNVLVLYLIKDNGNLLRTLSEIRGALINIGG